MKTFLLIVILLFTLIPASFSQKVGLVLSGGGAKGIAHIGVIRALEENGIPIDYIAGTSIGAMVGALYAAGYSPEEMEALVMSEDFLRWSKGLIEEKYIYYFKMKDKDAAMINIDFSEKANKILQLPNNFIPTHQMDLAMINAFSPAIARAHYNFDSLFVPFRCIASDIQKGKEAILKDGDLALAVRASMTYPVYFDAIKIDNDLMFDGGIYNNFPIDVMERDFKPDIIIGVAVASDYSKPIEDNILLQIERMIMQHVSYQVPEEKGILISPDVGYAGLLDIERANDLLFSGYVAADNKMDEIKKRISRRVSKEDVNIKRKAFSSSKPPLYFKNIYIEGLNKSQDYFIARSIRHRQKVFSFDKMKPEFFKLYMDERIATIYPRVLFNENEGYYDLYLNVKRKPRLNASIGGNISSSSINQLFASVRYNYLAKRAISLSGNVYAGRFYSSVNVSTRLDFPTNPPFYIDPSVTYNRWNYYKGSSELFFEDVRPDYIIQNEYNVRTDIGFPLTTNGIVYFGGTLSNMSDEYYQTDIFYKKDTADRTDFDLYSFHLGIEKNTLNFNQYADEGSFLNLRAGYIEGEEIQTPGSTSHDTSIFNGYHDWLQLRLTAEKYFPVNKEYTFGYYIDAVYSSQKFFHNYISSVLSAPAFQPTPHSKTLFLENYHAYNYFGFGLKNIFRLNSKFHFRLEGYVFQPYQKILENNAIDKEAVFGEVLKDRSFIGTAAIVYQTPIGPASISVNYYDKKDQTFYFLFNFGYTIFNKRGID